MEFPTLLDIYRCPHCDSIGGRGDLYCRGCGVHFTKVDIEHMEQNIRTPLWASPWNLRDRFYCLKCNTHVSITDHYCRQCGDEFDVKELKLMKLNLRELAVKNTPASIGLAIFVLVTIWVLIKISR
jgi:ribosomal protein L40E